MLKTVTSTTPLRLRRLGRDVPLSHRKMRRRGGAAAVTTTPRRLCACCADLCGAGWATKSGKRAHTAGKWNSPGSSRRLRILLRCFSLCGTSRNVRDHAVSSRVIITLSDEWKIKSTPDLNLRTCPVFSFPRGGWDFCQLDVRLTLRLFLGFLHLLAYFWITQRDMLLCLVVFTLALLSDAG